MNFLEMLSRLIPKRSRKFARLRSVNGLRARVAHMEQLETRTMLSVDFVQVADSLDEQLVSMQERVTAALNFFQTGATSNIPIVGDKLGQAADIVDSFRDELHDALEVLGTSTPTPQQLQTSLADQLGSFLGAAGINGVHVSKAGSITTVEMILQGSAVVDGIDIGFSIGLPSLPIEFVTHGSLDISIGYALEVAFKINDATGDVTLVDGSRNLTGVTAPDGAHPLLDNNSDLALFVSAGPSSDFSAKAVFGFVEGTATPIPGEANGLSATARVSNLLTAPTIKLDGSADVNLRLTRAVGDVNAFPGISADFILHWGLSSTDPEFGAPTAKFDNVALSYGSFLSNVLRPVLEPIKDTLDPISPILNLLGAEIPGFSDLTSAAGLGRMTILDLATVGSQVTGNGPLGELAAKITKLLQMIDSIQLGPEISIPLGGFDLGGSDNADLREEVLAGNYKDLDQKNLTKFVAANLTQAAQQAAQKYHEIVDELEGLSPAIRDELHGLAALPTQNGFQIEFPVLDDPAAAIFGMLLGQDSDLFYFQADADIDLRGSQASGLSFFGQPINLVGLAQIDAHFKFGYDTYGLRQLISNLAAGDDAHIFSDITDGYYISDDSYFKMAGKIGAEWGVSVFDVFPVSIAGGLFTQEQGTVPLHVYIEDPNGDGKLRFGEFFPSDVSNGQPTAFRMTGQLIAGIYAEVSFPDPDGDGPLFEPPHEVLEVAEEALITFGMPTPLHLASNPDANGQITLFLGTNAHRRANAATDTGDEKFVIQHLASNPDGSEKIRIRAFGLQQEINNVRSIKATDQVGTLDILVQPGVTSSVDFTGGQGAAFMTYSGTGTAKLTGGALASRLQGGKGPSILTGGAGDDTIQLGSGANTIDAGGGNNTVILRTDVRQTSTINGGTAGYNTLRIIASPKTYSISARPVDGAIQVGMSTEVLDLLNPVKLTFSNFDEVYFAASFNPALILLGDLAAAGVKLLTLDMQTFFPSARSIDLNTHNGFAPSVIAIHDYVYQGPALGLIGGTVERHGAVIENATTGLTTRLLGFHSKDTLTLRHHGGSITIDALPFTGGNFVFNTTNRAPNTQETINITTPPRPNGILTVKERFRNTLISLKDSSSYLFLGSRHFDETNLFVGAASTGENTIDINAAAVHGEFNVAMLGDITAVNHVTLRRASLDADVSILGQDTTTDLLLGVGELALIRHDVFASDIQLAVNNDHSILSSILTLDATSFGRWNIPTLLSVKPQLIFENLRSHMRVDAGPGDRFQLDVTPSAITGLSIYNDSLVRQDLVYTANWSVPLNLTGNFSFYAGRVLHRDGTVERIKKTALVNSVVNLDFAGNGPSEVIFDADLDEVGAQYNITGRDGLFSSNSVANTTVGLYVTVLHYREQDRFYIHATGATIDANLQAGPPPQFHFDGQARLGEAGIHPTAPNLITIATRYGSAFMTPLAEFNSLLDMYNDVYVLGAMPQDSLAVTMPTHVRMTSAIGHTFNLELNPNAGVVLDVIPDHLVSWMSDFPQSGEVGSQQVFKNTRPGNWDTVFPPGPNSPPNPFGTPYGIEIAHLPDEIVPPMARVINYRYEMIGGVRTRIENEYRGFVRYWVIDPNPVAVNNDVRLNASQLRGDLSWNVTAPDYDYVRRLQNSMFLAVTESVSFNYPFYTWGTSHDFMRVAFAQSDIRLSHVNPELEVDIDGGTPPFDYRTTPNHGPMHSTVVSPYPVVRLNVGDGELTNLRGDVTAEEVQLEVDDRNGSQPNVISMTADDISWFDADNTRTTLDVSKLRSGLTLTGSGADRFAIEGSPELFEDDVIERGPSSNTIIVDVPEVVTIRNFAPAARDFVSPGVYLMAHSGKQVLDVVGNLSLYMGRRLLPDGTVENVGDLSGVTTFERNVFSQSVSSHTVNYTYTGLGRGTLVYDGSNYSAEGSFALNEYPVSIMSDVVPNRAALRWQYDTFQKELFTPSESINTLTFGGNTSLEIYAPIVGFKQRSLGQNGMLIDNPTSAAINYFSNPLSVENRNDTVHVWASSGPLNVTGRGSLTRVVVQAVIDNVNPNGDLRSLIAGNMFVTNAALLITPTNALTPANTPQPVVLTDTQLTGLTGGVVSFSNLANYANLSNFSTGPGLAIGLPHYGAASLTVNGSPLGVATAFNTVKDVPIGPTTVTGTNGELWLGLIAPGGNSNDPRRRFQTSSLVIGDGDLDGIQGSIRLSSGEDITEIAPGGVTINNQFGAAVADAEFKLFEGTISNDHRGNSIELSGLAPASIFWRRYLTTEIDILGSANSHYTISSVNDNVRLFAGEGSTVDIYRTDVVSTPSVGEITILGAETVLFNRPPRVSVDHPVRILPDPARPDEITDVTFDSTKRNDLYYLDSPLPGEGRIGNGPFSQPNQFNLSYVLYDANHTHLTFLGFALFPIQGSSAIHVQGTPALTTEIVPGYLPMHVSATTNPLDIHLTSGSKVTLGSTGHNSPGDMRALLGNVAISVDAAANSPAAIRFNSSADPTPRTVSVNPVSANESTVTGMTSMPLSITGQAWTLELNGGSGNNTFAGPNVASDWLIDGANSGKLNQKVSFTGIQNVVSGSQDDTILFKPGGTLAGNLDGGPGTDTLRYQSGMLTPADIIDLPNRIAPRVTGQALNLESSGTFTALAVTSPGNQVSTSGTQIAPLSISTTGGAGTKTFSATGLPDGISIDSQTGVLTGTPLNVNQFTLSTRTFVTVTDDSGTASVNFTWDIFPGLTIALIPPQTVDIEEPVSLQVQVTNPSGGTLTYSATGLPPGLSINSGTGLITGTVPDGAERPESYVSTISVTNGSQSTQQLLSWNVVKPEEEIVIFTLNPATIPENSPNGTVVGNLTPDHVPTGWTFTYLLTDNAGGRFALNGSQVVVADGAALDFESNSSHVVSVTIEDSEGTIQLQDFTIAVTNVNEGVLAFALSPASVSENAPSGTVVGDIIPDNVPDGVTFTYSLTNNAGERFSLNGSQVIVATDGLLNYELSSSHVITVRIQDSDGNIRLQDFTISVTNINEASTIRFIKNQGAVSLVPEAILTDVGQALAGGSLRLSITDVAAGKKQKRFDKMQTASLNELGTVSETQVANGMRVITVQLGAAVTAGQIQAALKAVKFETAGKGLKTPTREVKVETMSAAGVAKTVFSETMQVLKKQPRQRARNSAGK